MIGQTPKNPSPSADSEAEQGVSDVPATDAPEPSGHGGQEALDPTRYGDWEKNGRCIDF